MGKKVKPSSLLDTSVDNSVQQAQVEENIDVFQDASLVGNGKLTLADKEKLEKYDSLEKSVVALSEEKAMLEDKVAEYAEKLEELKDAAAKIKSLEEKCAKLTKDFDDMQKEAVGAASLSLEKKALREEADSYLVKISELTFENANLRCQLDELSKNASSSGIAVNQQKFSPRPNDKSSNGLASPFKDAYNPYKNNGYEIW